MADELHIRELEISIEDWIAYVEKSPDLELIHEASIENPLTGDVITINIPNSGKSTEGQFILSTVREDRVSLSIKYADELSLILIKRVAADLYGTVTGDEGESY